MCLLVVLSRVHPDGPLVVDIRTPDHFAEMHVPGSTNIPQDDLATRIGELPEDREDLLRYGLVVRHQDMLNKRCPQLR